MLYNKVDKTLYQMWGLKLWSHKRKFGGEYRPTLEIGVSRERVTYSKMKNRERLPTFIFMFHVFFSVPIISKFVSCPLPPSSLTDDVTVVELGEIPKFPLMRDLKKISNFSMYIGRGDLIPRLLRIRTSFPLHISHGDLKKISEPSPITYI